MIVVSMYFGATAVGIKLKDAVVLATDRRMAYGSFVMSRNAKKIFMLDKRIGIAFAGLYGDLRGLFRILEAEYRFMKMTINKEPPVKSIAKRLSMILYSYKAFPFLVEIIVGGIDPYGETSLYVLDSLGSLTEEPYIAVGSGASIALGFLEDSYREDLDLEEAVNVAVKAVKAAIERDSYTGDGIDVVAITKDGVIEKSYKLRLVEGQ